MVEGTGSQDEDDKQGELKADFRVFGVGEKMSPGLS